MSDEKKINYANSVNLSVSIFDFIMDFGVRKPKNLDDNGPEHETSTIVVMSPQHAKVMAKLLRENINKYEEVNGEIKIPSNVIGTQN